MMLCLYKLDRDQEEPYSFYAFGQTPSDHDPELHNLRQVMPFDPKRTTANRPYQRVVAFDRLATGLVVQVQTVSGLMAGVTKEPIV